MFVYSTFLASFVYRLVQSHKNLPFAAVHGHCEHFVESNDIPVQDLIVPRSDQACVSVGCAI